MKYENSSVPKGFENYTDSKNQYKSHNENQKYSVNFGRKRGGPGRGMAQPVEKPKETKKTLVRLIKYFGEFKILLLLLTLAVVAVTITSLAAPALQGKSIDIIASKQWQRLTPTLVMLLAVYAIQVCCTLAQALLSARISQNMVSVMRHDLFCKIDNLSIKYLDTHSNGDVMSRMTNDVENISSTISQSLGSLISGVLTVIGTITIMFTYCPQLTLITLSTVILTAFVTKKMSKAMRKIFKKRSEVLGALNGHAEEMITGYKSIAAFNKQNDVIEEFNRTSDELAKVGTKAEILGGSMGPIMNFISNISFVIVAAFGGYFALKGIITIGVISAFIIYAKQFSRPINEIAQLYGSVQTAIAGAERVFELMDHPNEDKSGNLNMDNAMGKIEFKNVNFSYVPQKQVLYDFNLTVKPGQKIALVGPTGSGKTTVVNLLMRFYPIDSGQILIDGKNINEINRDELRKNVAIVLQDTVLFSDTIENNIRYSRIDATDEEVIQAAKMSNCHNFIESLPNKYKTFLKHAGESLSQGQRQLITIARAVIANPRILILDEATSSVDTRTERHIQDAMVKLMKDRTSLIIAHRLSTIQDADVIVVMDSGRVVEIGNHEELIKQKGKYYDLYMTQFAGNLT